MDRGDDRSSLSSFSSSGSVNVEYKMMRVAITVKRVKALTIYLFLRKLIS
ncbi:MAG: hypothetical protein N3H31_01945 [Candidatus Nezhaarchaeota archaeon]|nr:hypothetical protein [Candidatus Nezhaarchaeota archaeon]